MVDYGNYGDKNTGEVPSKGDRLAGVEPVLSTDNGITGFPPDKYIFTDFNADTTNFTLETVGLNFSSGAPVFDSTGNIDAIDIASTDNTESSFGVSLRLNTAQVQAELAPRIAESWASVPEPSSACLLGVMSAALLSRRRLGFVLRKECH